MLKPLRNHPSYPCCCQKKKVAMELIKAFCGDAGPLQVDGDLMFNRSFELERFWENGQIVEIWTVWEYLESK